MIRVRRVDGVAIVDWSHKDVAGVVPQLRTLLDARDARHVLLNMSEVESLKGEGLEALTEALTLCEDGGCTLGMYALNTYLTKLLEIMDLSGVMPPVLGAAEPEAISRVRKLEVSHASPRAEAAAAAAPAAEIVFEPVSTAIEPPGGAARPASRRVDGNADVEFELDLPEATGKRGRPAPAEIAATLKFDKQGVAGAPADEKPDDMLAVVWSELTMQGLRLGGPGGAELTARAQAEAPSSGASTAVLRTPNVVAQQPGHAAAAPQTAREAAELNAIVQRPTARLAPSAASGESRIDIDLDTAPAILARARKAEPPRDEYKTEVIKAFDVAELAKAEAAEASESGAAAGQEAAIAPPVDFGELKPLDETAEEDAPSRPVAPSARDISRPAPPGASPHTPQPQIQHRTQTPPRPQPARPGPATPAENAPQIVAARAAAPPPQARQTPPRGVPPASVPAQPPPAPVPARPAPQPAPQAFVADGGDETVMFQPDGLLAEVLAAVAPAPPPPPNVPSDTTLDLVLKNRPKAGAAPALKAPAKAAQPADGKDELRFFLRDYAIVTELHLRVLDRFSREGTEKILGRPEVQAAVSATAAAVSTIIEDFVQARLLKRRRSPRVRGGTGFLYSPSPKTRNVVTRLLKHYEDGTTRAEVLGWIQAARGNG